MDDHEKEKRFNSILLSIIIVLIAIGIGVFIYFKYFWTMAPIRFWFLIIAQKNCPIKKRLTPPYLTPPFLLHFFNDL